MLVATFVLARGRLSEYLEALANGDLVAWFLLIFFVLGGAFSTRLRRRRRRFW